MFVFQWRCQQRFLTAEFSPKHSAPSGCSKFFFCGSFCVVEVLISTYKNHSSFAALPSTFLENRKCAVMSSNFKIWVATVFQNAYSSCQFHHRCSQISLFPRICSDTPTLVLVCYFWCQINEIPCPCLKRGSDTFGRVMLKWEKKYFRVFNYTFNKM